VRRICLELPVAGIDVAEVSPPYDHAEITACLANRLCLEALSGLAARKVGITHDPAGRCWRGAAVTRAAKRPSSLARKVEPGRV
jgi:agmatinase